VDERTVYEISCAHKPSYGNCVHDIEAKPILFREKNYCFFCKYPQGIPDMKPLKEFMIANADKYGIVPYWNGQELSVYNTFTHDKYFGSYKFEASKWSDYFELSNARNRFLFYVDCESKTLIVKESSSYMVRKYLGTSEYNHETRKSTYEPIKNYDKFATWLWQIVDDFNASK
jgi:hypothetical protein